MSGDGSTPAASTADRMCPFCHAPLGDTTTAPCHNCGTLYHDDCLAASGRCAVPGCASEEPATPPSGHPSRSDAPPPVTAQPPPGPARPGAVIPTTQSNGWHGSEPSAGGVPAPPTASQEWLASLQLIWEDVPVPWRWGAGITLTIILLVTAASLASGNDRSEPEVTDRPADAANSNADEDEEPFDDSFDVNDDAYGPNNAAYRALSDNDQGVCEVVNRRLRSAVADDQLEPTELLEIVGYAYRYSDVGGRLESSADDLLSAIRDEFEGRGRDGEIERAGGDLLYVCNYRF